MYMSYHGNNRKRKIAIIAGAGAVGVITYAAALEIQNKPGATEKKHTQTKYG
jgi:hypothetical protein